MSIEPLSRSEKSTNVRAVGTATTSEGRAALERRLRQGLAAAERVHPQVAAHLARLAFLTPVRHPRPARETALLADAERFTVRVGARRVAAWSWGDGAPVLLVHGWEGRGAQLGAFVKPLVDADLRVVAFDAPGHGESDGWTTNLPEMAAAVLAVDHAVGGAVGVVAHSFGACAVSLAMVEGFAPLAAVYVAPAAGVEETIARYRRIAGFGDDVESRLRADLARRTTIPLDRMTRDVLCGAHPQPPLLVVHDADDDEVPTEEARSIVDAWPGARLMETHGLGHRRILRDPSVVAAASAHLGAR